MTTAPTLVFAASRSAAFHSVRLNAMSGPIWIGPGSAAPGFQGRGARVSSRNDSSIAATSARRLSCSTSLSSPVCQ
jgi:hypothetical protein